MSLPSGWKLVKLADVAAKQPNALVDGPFGSNLKTTDYVNDGVPVLQGKNITGNKFQWFDVRFISEKKAHSLRRSLVKEGDILIVKIGSIGYSAQIDSLHGYPHAMIPANLCKLTPDLSVIDPIFLVYYLNSNNSVNYLRSNASATSQPALSLGKIKELPVPLPPLTEQKRIASLLRRADRLRHLRRTAHDLGESLLQSVFLEMFGEYLKLSHPFTPMEELVKITGGGTPSRDVPEYFTGIIPWLTSKDMRGDYIYDTQEHITEKAIKESATNLIPVGSILLVVKSKILMRRLPIAVTKVPLCHGQDIKSIQCSNKVNPLFLVHVLKHNEQNLLNQARGANTEGLTLPMLNEIKVPNVPLSMQEEFAGVVARVESLRGRMSEGERQVNGLFESLLAESFDGRR